MFPPKGSNPYGQQPPYGGEQSYGKIPGSSGFGASAATGGADGGRFGAHAGQGAAGQYGGPYASVYGTQQVDGLGVKGPASSSLPRLPTHPTSLSESSKFSSGSVGASLARSNGDYMTVRGYAQKLDQHGTDYTLERRMYSEHSANLGRRDGLTDLDRRYPDHIPAGNQIHDRVEQGSSMRHQQLLKAQVQLGSDIRQADYFAGRSAPIRQGSQEIGSYGRVESDHRNLSTLGTVPYGGQQAASLLGGAPRTNIDSLGYGQVSSSSGYGMGLPPGRDYASGKGLLHPSLDSDYRDSILSRVHPGISMVDERTVDRIGYRRELDRRDEEHRRDLLLEREKEQEWERERERERDFLDLRDRERERERGRERDRERLRERERERERLRERREKERERDRNHGADSRRERTPPRTSGDRRHSSDKSEKPLRRHSPRRDAAYRHRSPVKEIKREYICKVLPFRLVDDERDYLSLTKRYPRLAITPDFSKIVFNWAKESLNLSLHTPVSLEHNIHEVDDRADERAMLSSEKTSSTKIPETIWNAKVLLMSGMSNGAFADITSLRSTEERVMHLNNILKFAVFKKDRSPFAIGGPWNAAIDGGDPLVDCACLIRTAIRYVKELVQVDLSNCIHWNRFLEVHYNRVGKDGLFSHKEITVLFVPNMSECLPSVHIWKNNWIAYRKSKAEREQLTMKKEKSPSDAKEQKQGELSQSKSTYGDHSKVGDVGHSATKNERVDVDMHQQGRYGEGNLAEDNGENPDKVKEHVEKTGGVVEGNTSVDHAVEDKKPMKKKVIKKVVKVVRKKPAAEASADKSSQLDKNVVAETMSKTVKEHVQQKSEGVGKEQEGTGINQQPEAKKAGKKKIIRRVVKRKVSASASELTALAAPAETSKQELEVQPEKNGEGLVHAGNSQTKLEVGSKAPAEDISNQKKEPEQEEKGHMLTNDQKSNGDKVNQQEVVEQKDTKIDGNFGKKDKTKDDKEKKNRDHKMDPKQKSLNDTKEKKSDEPPKHPGFILQAKRSKESKVRSTSLSLDGLLDYTANDIEESVFELSLFAESFSEMLQYRMGCVILSFLEKLHKHYVMKRNQRKRQREEDLKKEDNKSSKKRPKTTDETLTESTPNNPDKNDEMAKEGEEKMSTDATDHSAAAHDELIKEGEEKMSTDHSAAAHDELIKEGEEKMGTDHLAAAHNEPEVDEKMEDEDPEYEEDPEEVEIYEDDEDMDDATAEELVEEQNEDNSNDREAKPPEVTGENDGNKKTVALDFPVLQNEDNSNEREVKPPEETKEDDGNKTTVDLESENIANINEKSASAVDKQSVAEKGDLLEIGEKAVSKEGKTAASQKGDSAKEEVVDKDLLQAFRYFDQSRAGYIKVDDLRCILHNLGKFLSNRDVKGLVQIALVESNSARDNRIIYTKLVKNVDL